MILALDLVAQRQPPVNFPAIDRRGLRAYQYGLQHGALLRPLGDTLYLMPPYVITDDQVSELVATLHGAVDAATR